MIRLCGILGGISVSPFMILDDPARLTRAVDSLTHRGPDDSGVHIASDRRSFLGHRRLSIIDLAGGHQPIASEDESLQLCYNGEIYNFADLSHELKDRGHRFRTRVDGEAALHLYEESGIDFVQPLQGMFAIAILDEKRGELTLARDRNGIKPLYYYQDETSLIFASEIKAILALLETRPAVDPHALREYLRWKFVPSPLTIFECIHKLPPGHLLNAQRNTTGDRLTVSTQCYWQPSYDGEKLCDEQEAIERLDHCLRESVKSHLVADVDVGALLSGGVDSSLVVALAAIQSDKRIKTFSVGFKESGFDQLPFARKLAERYDTDHHEDTVAFDPMETVPKLVRQFDEPFADSSALACYRVCQMAGDHVKVVLTGDGGDESFAGYRRYEDMLAMPAAPSVSRRALNRFILATSGAMFSPEAKFLKRIRAAGYGPYERHEEHQVMCSRSLTDRLLTDAYRASGQGVDRFDQLRTLAIQQEWDPIEIAQFVDLRMYLPDDILTKVDRTSMACSLECRVPLLDHSVTQFSASIAHELKIQNGVRKYLLKKVAERYVPHQLLYRPKMGFRVPIRRWFKRDLLRQTEDLMLSGAMVEHGILDPAGLKSVFRRQRYKWIDFGSHLWALLCLEHWGRAYL